MTTFPAFTICPDYANAYKENILAQYSIHKNDFRNSLKFPSNLQMSAKDFVDLITYNLTELVAGNKKFNTNHTIKTSIYIARHDFCNGIQRSRD